jgi:hypothetical protein
VQSTLIFVALISYILPKVQRTETCLLRCAAPLELGNLGFYKYCGALHQINHVIFISKLILLDRLNRSTVQTTSSFFLKNTSNLENIK